MGNFPWEISHGKIFKVKCIDFTSKLGQKSLKMEKDFIYTVLDWKNSKIRKAINVKNIPANWEVYYKGSKKWFHCTVKNGQNQECLANISEYNYKKRIPYIIFICILLWIDMLKMMKLPKTLTMVFN